MIFSDVKPCQMLKAITKNLRFEAEANVTKLKQNCLPGSQTRLKALTFLTLSFRDITESHNNQKWSSKNFCNSNKQ